MCDTGPWQSAESKKLWGPPGNILGGRQEVVSRPQCCLVCRNTAKHCGRPVNNPGPGGWLLAGSCWPGLLTGEPRCWPGLLTGEPAVFYPLLCGAFTYQVAFEPTALCTHAALHVFACEGGRPPWVTPPLDFFRDFSSIALAAVCVGMIPHFPVPIFLVSASQPTG